MYLLCQIISKYTFSCKILSKLDITYFYLNIAGVVTQYVIFNRFWKFFFYKYMAGFEIEFRFCIVLKQNLDL